MAEILQNANATNKVYTGTGTENDLDIVSYTNAPEGSNLAGVVASLTPAGTIVPAQTSWAEGTTYQSIEGLEGSRYHDLLIGNAGNNMLYGGTGSDTLQGGAGADTLVGASVAGTEFLSDLDVASYAYAAAGITINLLTGEMTGDAEGDVYIGIEGFLGSAHGDTLTGNDGHNWIDGGAGDDIIEGGNGRDTLRGGEGNDTLSFAHATGKVTASLAAGGGTSADGFSTTYSGFETIVGSQFDDFLNGDGQDNLLVGGAGDDLLYGGAGNDTLDSGTGTEDMQGGLGDDLFIVNDAATYLREATGEGNDTVVTSVSFTLNFAEIETLRAVDGVTPINLIGNAIANTIIGNDGTNFISGGGGADILEGKGGNDVYQIDNAGDVVIEAEGGGTADSVYSFVSHTLSEHVENLYASGSSAIRLTGNGLGNAIMGNSAANVISGGSGDDIINGGAGKDVLYGGAGYDTFLLTTKASSKNYDKLADFYSKHDTIKLENKVFTGLKAGKLASSAFWKGTKAHDKNDRVIYDTKKGYLYFDADGTGSKYKPVLFATMKAKTALSVSDFIVI